MQQRLHCKKSAPYHVSDVWLSAASSGSGRGASVARGPPSRHSGRGPRPERIATAAPRVYKRATRDPTSRDSAKTSAPNLVQVLVFPHATDCEVQPILYLFARRSRDRRDSRPICTNTVDLFKFPIDGLEWGSTTSYTVFDVLRNSFHVCWKQIEVRKTKDTRALVCHCLLRCSSWQVGSEDTQHSETEVRLNP